MSATEHLSRAIGMLEAMEISADHADRQDFVFICENAIDEIRKAMSPIEETFDVSIDG